VADEFLILAVIVMLMISGIDWGGGWTWPVPDVDGGSPAIAAVGGSTKAMISQEFKPGKHLGVDIMYRVGGRYVAPVGTPILAAREATVWSVGMTARGINVVLDHGAPFATWYQHLETVLVKKGQRVKAGEQIGTMGADPTDPQGLRHLHFAVWYQGHGDAASVDPAAAMRSWRRVSWS